MFSTFFYSLKKAEIPVSLKEYLTFLDAVKQGVADYSINDFYYLSRASLVKDERHIDRFDQVFGHCFKGLEVLDDLFGTDIPAEWLKTMAELHLTPEEMEKIESLGGWDELMETLKKRLEEQKKRHQGGNKWIGTGGKSPFGANGYNPEGVRIGQESGRSGRAVKVWDKREYKNLDDTVEIGIRNIKVALRKLRRFAREGAPDELDLSDTIRSTARNGGFLDLKMVPERHNAVNVLLFFDVGGSMDPYIKLTEELFSAARSEFKHLEYFYFHNCPYEAMWKDNKRRHVEKIPTWEVLHTYGSNYKCIFVGDASMSPYEIMIPGGGNEHFNEEAGHVWLERVTNKWSSHLWINPTPKKYWDYSHTTQIIKQIFDNKMVPLTIEGLVEGTKILSRKF